ncbi:MAG: hypothetical protein AAGF88_08420 [Pseudomonadota bacterium]
MSQTLAYWIGGFILVLLMIDAALLGWAISLASGQQVLRLVEWMAFWR